MSGYDYVRTKRLLTVEDLTVTYDKPVLSGISFHVDQLHRDGFTQGQSIALLGPSGIGKTTLFRCIAGLEHPTRGSVKLNEHAYPVEAGEVGVVMQSYPLLAHRTVLGNLNLVCKTKEDRARATTMLERFKLIDKRHLYPCQLSGGQRQRVAIIQQLLCSSHFLLMDEPFSGLDPIAKIEVCRLINEIDSMDELNTIIIITHDLESALMTADTVLLLGRDKDASGNVVPGAKIKQTFDLIERGLAWHPDIDHLPNYYPTLQELKASFKDL
jgi:polar amino acid transport system ATP-binding protein/sulfate transport system ATP-binding protein